MRGVSEIVSVIILMLILISITAVAYFYYRGFLESDKTIRLRYSEGNGVEIDNLGVKAINLDELQILVNGEKATIIDGPERIDPGKIANIKFVPQTPPPPNTLLEVRLIGPSNVITLTTYINCFDNDNDGASLCNIPVDCNDENPAMKPGFTEVCDGIDNDCDGQIDEDIPLQNYYQDNDNDLFGNPSVSQEACLAPPGFIPDPGDCNDYNPDINPGKPEICDGINNNCDGNTDEGCQCVTGQTRPCGTDTGNCVAGTESCSAGTWGACTGSVGPSTEVCDSGDNDCDGLTDEDSVCVYTPSPGIVIAGDAEVGLGSGTDIESWNHKVFFDHINDRWHVLYIDKVNKLRSKSAKVSEISNTVNWKLGDNMFGMDLKYEDFSAAMDVYSDSKPYLHVVASEGLNIRYNRCELTGTAPDYMICGTEQIAQSALGAMENARIAIDSDHCAYIVFLYGVPTRIGLIKEAFPCGDGTWLTEYQKLDIQGQFAPAGYFDSSEGYGNIGLGIESYGDDDMQIFWINVSVFSPDPGSAPRLLTRNLDGSTGAFKPTIMLDPGAFSSRGYTSFWSDIIGNKAITLGKSTSDSHLGSFTYDRISNSATPRKLTGLDSLFQSEIDANVACAVDTISLTKDLYCFTTTSNPDRNDIYLTKSSDGGNSWTPETRTFIEDGGDETNDWIRFMSAGFNKENCIIMITWLAAQETVGSNDNRPAGSTYDVRVAVKPTGSC